MGNHLLGAAGRGTAVGVLVGLHHPGVGRFLVLGPGGERGSHALAGSDGFYPLHNGAEAAGNVPHVEHCANQRCLWSGPVRNVHEPRWSSPLGPLLWRVEPGVGVPDLLGCGCAGALRCIHLALPFAQKRSKPGFHVVQGGCFPDQQPAASGDCFRYPLGDSLSPAFQIEYRRRDHRGPALLRSSQRPSVPGLDLSYGSGPPVAMAPGYTRVFAPVAAGAGTYCSQRGCCAGGSGYSPALPPVGIWTGCDGGNGDWSRMGPWNPIPQPQ